MLRDAMVARGVPLQQLAIVEIDTDDQAEERDFPGSPTIRVDGADIQDPGDQPRGLTCRVYRRRDGRISPLPDPADIDDALAAAYGGSGRTVDR